MASPGILNFLDLPPEEEPASKDSQHGSSKTPKKSSLAAEFLPMLSTEGLESDSGDDLLSAPERYQDVLAMACEPPPQAFPGVPTHVILRVLKISGLPMDVKGKGIPGRESLGFFLEEKDPLQRSTAAWDRDAPGVRPRNSLHLAAIPDAFAYIALELFPPGSQFPARPLTGEEQMERNVRELQAEPVIHCRFCDGYGRRSCDGCGGHGILVCGTCDGMPALPCPACRGNGLLQDNLEGIGGPLSQRKVDGEVVSTVRGRRCQNCWGAPLTCKACFGAAALRCNICNGAGWSAVDVDVEQKEAVALRDGQNAELGEVLDQEYTAGFYTDIESESLPKGLNEDIVRKIWEIKEEPDWMLEFRLNAFRKWKSMKMPEWAHLEMAEIDFQDIVYYSRPKSKAKKQSLDEVDPELLNTFEKLGIPLTEQKRLANVAVDAVFDSESIGTTFQKELQEAGVIFCSINEAIKEHPELIKKYLGSVVPTADNYFAALNSAVFSDGSFCYIPKGTTCPMEISTYFRINNKESGQFERTLLIADEQSYVSYLEGCTAPMFDSKQLHAAVVELHAAEGAEIKYSTVQNWYAGDKNGKGGILNLVTKRGVCEGKKSKISWTQVETGSAVTWKYPSCVLKVFEAVEEQEEEHAEEAEAEVDLLEFRIGMQSCIVCV
ncbi:unnamed protein product [Durusdinium trenchii]|uniref:Uncharacterized protein n=1 Tax=Durusdinium trenchii TaxID=1381693 RepID=A0ABP0HFW0_9DINO